MDRQRELSFSYPHVEASRHEPPARWVVDHNQICLGHGPATWEAARAAIRSWSASRTAPSPITRSIVRRLQKRFAADSLAAMQRAVLSALAEG